MQFEGSGYRLALTIKSSKSGSLLLFQGCYDKLQSHISGNLDLAIGTVVGVAAAQLLAIVFAFCLCRYMPVINE